MKKARNILLLFSCLTLVQIAVPVSMIIRREVTLNYGKIFLFRTEPVDPYDAFRGRYVALRVEEDEIKVPDGSKYRSNQKVYVKIENDEEGFAKITDITTEYPSWGNYIRTKVLYISGNEIRLELPFDRYYMDEEMAPAAEVAYEKHSNEKHKDAYIMVRIKGGFSVVEDLYIDRKPIVEFLKENQTK